ncbi:MAG TPA: helix-turn-helix domain-containing protein [Polyangiaceae bacterium]|nr:helix-turn-helix domain-containing protein [Polyangiaceae bacterium]
MTVEGQLAARTYSTEGAPASERTNLLGRAMSETFSLDVTLTSRGAQPLDAELVGYRGNRLRFASMNFSPHTTTPTGTPRPRPQLIVCHQREGESLIEQGGHEELVRPGEIYLLDSARPYRVEAGEVRVNLLSMPPDSLRALVPQLDRLTGQPFSAHEGAGAIFRSMVDELFELAPRLSDETVEHVADALPHVLSAALTALDRAHEASPSALKVLHKQRIRRFALEHLGDPSLDVRAIAVGAGLSARYVHRLFADEPTTLMKWVWSERLEHCREELSMPSLRARSIGEIAYGWGFNDLAHFSRAFRERYGQSPRELRKAGRP